MTLKIEQVAVEKLTFDPSNARNHSDTNLGAIAQSLKQFGQRKPIVVTAENVIVAGNGTVKAAHSLGWRTVQAVRVPDDWTEEEIKAFALADNRTAELAEWNNEVLLEQLSELEQFGFDLTPLGFDSAAFQTPSFEPVDAEENPRLDQRTVHECPNCQTELEIVKGKLVQHD